MESVSSRCMNLVELRVCARTGKPRSARFGLHPCICVDVDVDVDADVHVYVDVYVHPHVHVDVHINIYKSMSKYIGL